MKKTRDWFIKACDDLWRNLVKIRAKFKCQQCGKVGFDLFAHHVFSRRAESTRFDLLNGVALCWECHAGAHKRVKAFKEWYELQIGLGAYLKLKQRFYKPTPQRMEDVYENLKNEMGREIC